MPWKWFINVVADEEENVQSHGSGGDDSSVGGEIFKVPHQHEFKEDNRIDTFLSFSSIVFSGGLINEA